MAQPNTRGEARRQGLRRSRWIAAGASVGAAAILTGTIAVVNAAPSSSKSNEVGTSDATVGSDELQPAEPFSQQSRQPTQQPSQQQVPQGATQLTPRFQPQIISRGS